MAQRGDKSSLCKNGSHLPVDFGFVLRHHHQQLLYFFARLRDQCEPSCPSRNVMRRRISEPRVSRDFCTTTVGFSIVACAVPHFVGVLEGSALIESKRLRALKSIMGFVELACIVLQFAVRLVSDDSLSALHPGWSVLGVINSFVRR